VSIEDIEQIATTIKTIIQSEPAQAPTGCRA
jgi:hypothetical protein